MTYEERLEVFDNYRALAESFAVKFTSKLSFTEAQTVGRRALWAFSKEANNGKLNPEYLKKVIINEITQEVHQFSNSSKAREFIRYKKHGPREGRCYYLGAGAEVVSVAEHGRAASGDAVDWNFDEMGVHTDKRDIWFENMPDDTEVPAQVRERIRLIIDGYSYKEVGRMYNCTGQAIENSVKKYVSRNRRKFDLTSYSNPVQSY